MKISPALAFSLLIVLLTPACGTLEDGRGWGQDAAYPVSWNRVVWAAKRAALDPVTWAPAAGALVFAIDDFDQRVSDWAYENTPLFGSPETAGDVGDYGKDALAAEVFLTGLLTPSGEDWQTWTISKIRGGVVEAAALGANDLATSLLKDATHRTRPNEHNDQSFPSAHASASFSRARLSNRNLDAIGMHPALRNSIKAGNLALASTVAWSRVEAQKHYPSDVLAGAALGNFLTTFIHDAFMNLPEDQPERVHFRIEPSPSGVWGALSWDF